MLTATPPLEGTGECIAVSEGSDVDQPSLAIFNTIFSLPPFVQGTNYDFVFPDGSPDRLEAKAADSLMAKLWWTSNMHMGWHRVQK